MKIYENEPILLPLNAAFDLKPLPGESMVSSLWRFAWRNGLRGNELLAYCTRDSGYAKEDVAFTPTKRFNAKLFSEVTWWPQQSHEADLFEASNEEHRSTWWSRHLRYCPLCLENLYHSYWHQSTFLSHCPFDGAQLRSDCYSCGATLPRYGFHREVLDRPYTCPRCRGPIAGTKVTLAARLSIQNRTAEFRRIVSEIDEWWSGATLARLEIETVVRGREIDRIAPWLHLGASMRNWIVDSAPLPKGLPVETKTLPSLVILKWRARLRPDIPGADLWTPRKSRAAKLVLARKVYRATLRGLMRAIALARPFTQAEYQRHTILPMDDLVRVPDQCNLLLLDFILLRRSYETYFSATESPVEEAELETGDVGFPYGNEFALRLRICWRAQMIAEFAAFYWWLANRRESNMKSRNYTTRSAAALSNADVEFDPKNGDLVIGSIAFPAIAGFNLTLFPRACRVYLGRPGP